MSFRVDVHEGKHYIAHHRSRGQGEVYLFGTLHTEILEWIRDHDIGPFELNVWKNDNTRTTGGILTFSAEEDAFGFKLRFA